jgi:hypothetical protein
MSTDEAIQQWPVPTDHSASAAGKELILSGILQEQGVDPSTLLCQGIAASLPAAMDHFQYAQVCSVVRSDADHQAAQGLELHSSVHMHMPH